MVEHISAYSLIIPGAAGSEILPSTTARRCRRRVNDWRIWSYLTAPLGLCSTHLLYTTAFGLVTCGADWTDA